MTLSYKHSKRRTGREDITLSRGMQEGFIRKVFEAGEIWRWTVYLSQRYRKEGQDLPLSAYTTPGHGESIYGTPNHVTSLSLSIFTSRSKELCQCFFMLH